MRSYLKLHLAVWIHSAYFQRALQTHPDKNPNNTGATAEFQQVSEAYRVLLKHLERSSRDEHNQYDYSSDFEDFDSDDGYNSDDFPDVSRLYEYAFIISPPLLRNLTIWF